MEVVSEVENRARMLRGEQYHAFVPSLIAERKRCKNACRAFNQSGDVPRRVLVELWRNISNDKSALPPRGATEEADDIILEDEPYIDAPIKADYGYNIILGKAVYINSSCTFIDTCPIKIGARTLVGPNCSFYSGTHPVDPFLRNGTKGPESGAPITVGEDCWFGGNVIVLPGVTVGRGATVGAGSVVTKDVPAFCVVAGNPAHAIRKVAVNASDPSASAIS